MNAGRFVVPFCAIVPLFCAAPGRAQGVDDAFLKSVATLPEEQGRGVQPVYRPCPVRHPLFLPAIRFG